MDQSGSVHLAETRSLSRMKRSTSCGQTTRRRRLNPFSNWQKAKKFAFKNHRAPDGFMWCMSLLHCLHCNSYSSYWHLVFHSLLVSRIIYHCERSVLVMVEIGSRK